MSLTTALVSPVGSDARSLTPVTAGSGWLRSLFALQGLYYLVTGVWPLVSIETFQLVTGPKTDHLPTGREADHWLVMTVGVLIVAVAVTLLAAACRRQPSWEVVLLAVTSALALTSIDVIYVTRQVIAPVYLVDAAAEVILVAGWVLAVLRQWRSFRA